jgi:RNA polymerase sigma factor for flagellar operon FliA
MSTHSAPSTAAAPAFAREHQRELYQRYLPLVRRIAMRTVRQLPSSVQMDDVISAGWLGMTEAMQRRAEGMNEDEFEAYASYRVRGAIWDYLRELDPLSRKLRGASRRITEVVGRLTHQLGRLPEEPEVAAELGMTLEDYQDLLTSIAQAGLVRLEVSSECEPAGESPGPEALVSRRELITAIAGVLEELPERLQLVLGLYYQEDCNLTEIGEVLGITASRVCQLHAQAVHLIRARLEGRAHARRPGLRAVAARSLDC